MVVLWRGGGGLEGLGGGGRMRHMHAHARGGERGCVVRSVADVEDRFPRRPLGSAPAPLANPASAATIYTRAHILALLRRRTPRADVLARDTETVRHGVHGAGVIAAEQRDADSALL